MKNLLWLLLIIIVAAGCGKKDDNQNQQTDENQSVTDSNIDRDALYDLSYKFNQGEKFTYFLTTVTNTTQSVDSDTSFSTDVMQTIKYKFIIDVLKVDEKKLATLAVNINHISLEASYDGKTVNYTSDMVLKGEQRMEYFEYETLKNTTYNVQISPTGEIKKITKLDEMIDNMVSIQDYQMELTEMERNGIAENLSSMLIKPLTQHLFRILPDHEIGIDSVWEHRYPSSLATFKIENIATFRMLKVNEIDGSKIGEFGATLKIKASGENSYTEKGVSYYFDPPVVNGNGTIKFDIDKGCLLKSNTTTRVETQGIVEAKDDKGQPQRAARKDITVSTNIIEKK